MLPFVSATTDTITYTDYASLLEDFQDLLSDPDLCDSNILIANQRRLAFPSAILSARSLYFQALLSPTWNRNQLLTLQAQYITPDVAQDLLEFLITGAVTLSTEISAINHNLSLAYLAHYTLCETLENIVADHIRGLLSVHNLTHYINGPIPSPSVERVLVAFVGTHAQQLAKMKPPLWSDATIIWRLLANASSAGLLPVSDATAAARFVLQYPALNTHLTKETSHDRDALLSLLLKLPVPEFASLVEPTGILPPHLVLNKYRGALGYIPSSSLKKSLFSPIQSQPPKHLSFPSNIQTCKLSPQRQSRRMKSRTLRLLCESTHPHPAGARSHTHIQKVRLPAAGAFSNALLTFDPRSALGDGAELTFYLSDPKYGAPPHTFLVGSELACRLILPATEFWYAFYSLGADDIEESCHANAFRWGWRFFVESVARRIDEVD